MRTLSALVTLFATLGATLVSIPALPSDWTVTGVVTRVEGSYLPGLVQIQMNVGAGQCPAGQWLRWNGKLSTAVGGTSDPVSNTKEVYDALLVALATGRQIEFDGFNNDPNGEFSCIGQHIHFK